MCNTSFIWNKTVYGSWRSKDDYLFFVRFSWNDRIIVRVRVISYIYVYFSGNDWLIIFLTMMAKLGVTVSYTTIYVYTVEQYPTVIRNMALGLGSFISRLSGIVVPFIISMVWWFYRMFVRREINISRVAISFES